MKIIVFAPDQLKEELLAQSTDQLEKITWITDVAAFANHIDADVFIDLNLDNNKKEIPFTYGAPLVIVNNVSYPYQPLPGNFVRINGWPTFLQRTVVEASGKQSLKEKTEIVFSLFNKKVNWFEENEVFISARIVSMIVNEAYLTVEEEVSTKDEIDTAMKTGTNYPYGPFEWSQKIGLNNICQLLLNMSLKEKRYKPSDLLIKEAQL